MPTPEELEQDERNTGRGNVEQVRDHHGDYTQIVISFQIAGDAWDAAKADPAQAANVVEWLDGKVAQ